MVPRQDTNRCKPVIFCDEEDKENNHNRQRHQLARGHNPRQNFLPACQRGYVPVVLLAPREPGHDLICRAELVSRGLLRLAHQLTNPKTCSADLSCSRRHPRRLGRDHPHRAAGGAGDLPHRRRRATVAGPGPQRRARCLGIPRGAEPGAWPTRSLIDLRRLPPLYAQSGLKVDLRDAELAPRLCYARYRAADSLSEE